MNDLDVELLFPRELELFRRARYRLAALPPEKRAIVVRWLNRRGIRVDAPRPMQISTALGA